MAKNLTKTNAREVMPNLYALVDADDELWASFCDLLTEHAEKNAGFRTVLNRWMNDRLNEDAFGTEGQLDPRGDQRDS